MKIRPKQGQVLVYMDVSEPVSDGGIHIPEQTQQRSQTGQVRGTGIWKVDRMGRLIAFPVSSGDRVVVNARRGRWLHSERERLKLVDQDDVLAVIDEKD